VQKLWLPKNNKVPTPSELVIERLDEPAWQAQR
jgi:hypothetical protein